MKLNQFTMESKYYVKGSAVSILDLEQMALDKKFVWVETRSGSCQYPAHELMTWRLKSLTRVRLFEAINSQP